MRLEDLLTILSKKTESYVNQSLLAESLGITRQTVSNRIKNESQITVNELKKIEEFFGINLFQDNSESNTTCIDYYSNVFASCGNGSIVFSEDKIRLSIATLLIEGFSKQKKYSMINATAKHPNYEEEEVNEELNEIKNMVGLKEDVKTSYLYSSKTS